MATGSPTAGWGTGQIVMGVSERLRRPWRLFDRLTVRASLPALLAALPALAVAVTFHLWLEDTATARAQERIQAAADLAAERIMANVEAAQRWLAVRALDSDVQAVGDIQAVAEDHCGAALTALAAAPRRGVNFLGVYGTDGRLLCAPPEAAAPAALSASRLERVVAMRQPMVLPNAGGREALDLPIAYGVGAEAATQVVLLATVDLASVLRRTAERGLPEGGRLEIQDPAGNLLAAVPPDGAAAIGGRVDLPFRLSESLDLPIVQVGDQLLAQARIDAGDTLLVLTASIPLEVVLGPVRQASRFQLLFVLAAGLLVAGIAALIARRTLVRPIAALVEVAERLGDGDLAARAPGLSGAGELARLARSVDRMAARIAAMVDQQRRYLDGILAASRDPVFIVERSGRLAYANPSALVVMGHDARGAVGRLWSELDVAAPAQLVADVGIVLRTAAPRAGELVWRDRRMARSERALSYDLSPVLQPDGTVGAVLGIGHDITGLRRLEAGRRAELASSMAGLLQSTIDSLDQGILVFDSDLRLRFWNRRYLELFDLPAKAMQLGLALDDLLARMAQHGVLPGDDLATVTAERIAYARSGTRVPIEVTTSGDRRLHVHYHPMADAGVAATVADVTEQLRAAAAIEHMAYRDDETGLPNAHMFRKWAAGSANASGRRLAAFIVVNCGALHETLRGMDASASAPAFAILGQRLPRHAGDHGMAARLDSAAFVILVHADDEAELERRIHELQADLSQPIIVAEIELQVVADLGIQVVEGGVGDAATAVRQAAFAASMAAREEAAGHAVRYDAEVRRGEERRQRIEAGLRRSLEDGDGLSMVFQPKVSLRDFSVRAAEALVRWDDAELGRVSPGEFVPLAERAGLASRLGEWVLRRSLALAAQWPERDPPLRVSVNVSPLQLLDRGFVDIVAEALADTAFAPTRLVLEVTENALARDIERAIAVMHELVALGVALSIDDFGTGHSSLSYLARFPVESVKIDQSFVRNMLIDDRAAAIVQATVGLAHTLGLRAIAEGVEDREQAIYLRAYTCDSAQGYLFARPLAPDDFLAHIAEPAAS